MKQNNDRQIIDAEDQLFFDFASNTLPLAYPSAPPKSTPVIQKTQIPAPPNFKVELPRVHQETSLAEKPFTTEARAAAIFLDACQSSGENHIKRVAVRFHPFRATLYSFKINKSGLVSVKLHVAFRRAPDDVLAQAARVMLARRRGRKVERSLYDSFIRAMPDTDFELPGARRATSRATQGPGVHRSLEESFQRINQEYFQSQLPQPELCWSPVRAKRLLGSYHHRKDRLIISRVFDSPKVPVFVLDFLMYHELLHKFLGVGRKDDGRRCIHGKEFRDLEKQYRQYNEARQFLKRI